MLRTLARRARSHRLLLLHPLQANGSILVAGGICVPAREMHLARRREGCAVVGKDRSGDGGHFWDHVCAVFDAVSGSADVCPA